ncbi:MAG: MFS transporter, partial [Pyrinomonadaceae bacterium]
TVYLARIIIGASLGFVGVLANAVLVSNWFKRRRGTAFGIALTGTSLGGALVPQVAAPLIEIHGWRTAMAMVTGVIWLALVPLIVLFVRDKPAANDSAAIAELGEGDANSSTEKQFGITLSAALRMKEFWLLALCAALIFYPIFVTSQQFILYLQSQKIGVSVESGAFMLSLLFFASIIGKFLFGFLSDVSNPVRVMLLCSGMMAAATLILPVLTASNAFVFIVPMGLGYGGTFVLIQRLVADFFGNIEYGKILGVLTVIETFGAATGGIITGRIADSAGGDYTLAFYAVIFVCFCAFITVLGLNRLPLKYVESKNENI